jgi:hypothetical protein
VSIPLDGGSQGEVPEDGVDPSSQIVSLNGCRSRWGGKSIPGKARVWIRLRAMNPSVRDPVFFNVFACMTELAQHDSSSVPRHQLIPNFTIHGSLEVP